MCSIKFSFAVLAVSVGSGIPHGFHTGVLNIPSDVLKKWIKNAITKRMSDADPTENELLLIWSTVLAMYCVGGIVGGCLTGCFADRCGRKASLLWNNVIAFVAAVMKFFSKELNSFELLAFGRFIAGINAGLNSGLCQIYLIEIAPDRIRGAVGASYQFFIIFGIMCSHFAGWAWGTEENWPYIFLLPLIPAVFQISTLPFCPETPKYLMISEDNEPKAQQALAWLRKTKINSEMEQLRKEDSLVKEIHTVTLKRMFNDMSTRRRLVVCLVLNIGQQFCGINAVVYFSHGAFDYFKLDENSATYITTGIGAFHVLVAFSTLFFIDSVGRRTLLLVGFLAMALDTVLLTIFLILGQQENSSKAYTIVGIVFIFTFVAIFATGIGPIPWFITAEIFNHRARSIAVTLTVVANWFSNFVLSQAFLPLWTAIESYIFIVFVVLDFVFYFFTQLYLPETNKLSAVDILHIYD